MHSPSTQLYALFAEYTANLLQLGNIGHRLSFREWAASALNPFDTLPLGIDLLSERAVNCNPIGCIDVEHAYIL